LGRGPEKTGTGGISSYRVTDYTTTNLPIPLDRGTKICYAVNEIGKDYVVVNGERIEVDPPFEVLPDKAEYETWLNEVMADAVKAIGSRAEISHLQDHLAQMAQGRETD
jgi:hypothetical protein